MHRPNTVDNTDWLKTFAIILVAVDHFGYFFIDNADWWSVFGRLAAPPFFFLMGYARTRTIPLYWLWVGIILTLLDSWNNDWTWVAPNILLSFALIRLARPQVHTLLQKYGWAAFALIGCALLALLPVTAEIVDYGAEGWLWALFGLCQRMYVDGRSTSVADSTARKSAPPAYTMSENTGTKNTGLMRVLACLVAAVVYVWLEQREFMFSQIQFAVFVLGVGVLSLGLIFFMRGPSRIQPPKTISHALHFLGRRTLEIYAIQLAGSELIIILLPELAA